ncbi:hypothetical protein MSG28_002155 [Choristoneura fumiferana]|uniref:Uncharacterized protein n=1 Tax=Choristoneura fumiferana TaxID=7141 RepID=A0ACC0JUA5_CHOFU|nr:hypothetical protein MSG28_002155 [Choristoneura fumiferana]
MSHIEEHEKVSSANELNASIHNDTPRQQWVKFEEDSPLSTVPLSEISPAPQVTAVVASISEPSSSTTFPAVLTTESVHVNLERADKTIDGTSQPTLSKNIEFVNVRNGFSNGDIIVTILPMNTKWPWMTAARFRPELVPEELMAQGLTQFIESEEGKSVSEGWEKRLDVTANDIVIQGSQSTRLSRKQERALLLYLRYVGRWGARILKKKLTLSSTVPGRHGEKYNCPCQFIEEHLKVKPIPGGFGKYLSFNNINHQLY